MRVLIADDDAGRRQPLCAAAERLGHECIAAGDGEEAWVRFRESEPEVVIAGAALPGLDGMALARRIRADPDLPYAYVILLTGEAGEAAARAAIEAGADDLVAGPPDPAELERRLIAAERITALHRRLHGGARQDALTGVGNRLRLAEDVEALCGRVSRYGHAYCVALLDVDMPGGGGVRAAIDIRELLPGVRIVALSADDSVGAQLDMSRAGAVGFVVKGCPDEEIVRVIRSAARW